MWSKTGIVSHDLHVNRNEGREKDILRTGSSLTHARGNSAGIQAARVTWNSRIPMGGPGGWEPGVIHTLEGGPNDISICPHPDGTGAFPAIRNVGNRAQQRTQCPGLVIRRELSGFVTLGQGASPVGARHDIDVMLL